MIFIPIALASWILATLNGLKSSLTLTEGPFLMICVPKKGLGVGGVFETWNGDFWV